MIVKNWNYNLYSIQGVCHILVYKYSKNKGFSLCWKHPYMNVYVGKSARYIEIFCNKKTRYVLKFWRDILGR